MQELLTKLLFELELVRIKRPEMRVICQVCWVMQCPIIAITESMHSSPDAPHAKIWSNSVKLF